MLPDPHNPGRHYALVARALSFIRDNARAQPSLEEVAAHVHVSPYHLQRCFSEWAGLSPKRFLQYLTKEHAKALLLSSQDALAVTHSVGLSSTSRLHDLMVTCEAMTPGEIKSAGNGLSIAYGFAHSPFGEALIAWTKRGICHVAFRADTPDAMLTELRSYWPQAEITRDDTQAESLLREIFPATPTRGKVHLVLCGTNFQMKIWEALIRTEPGQVLSYQRIATHIGSRQAQRAVGSAVAANHIGFLIPCHRVIRESGDIGNYRWGSERKLAMLAWEFGRADENFRQNRTQKYFRKVN